MRPAHSPAIAVQTAQPITVSQATTEVLSEFLAATGYDDLPAEIVHTSKRAILDLLGSALAAAPLADVRTLYDGVADYDHGVDASIWGTGRRASQPMAAMANGTAAHARELDDIGGPGHVGTVVIPAALAVAEARAATGREVVRAVALGYEVLFRITDGIGGYRYLLEPGWHPIAVVGGFGSAAAAGLLIGLSPQELVSALGLTGSFAGGDYAFLVDGSMSKRWHAGRAAANGIEAAYLARHGFVGPTHVLTTAWGSFYRTHFPQAPLDLDIVTRGLGDEFRMRDLEFKLYACCAGPHPFIEALNPLVASGRVTPALIETIDVECDPITAQVCGKRGEEVRTVLDAQMSLAFSLAVKIAHGRVTIREFDDPSTDQASRSLARRIHVRPVDGSNGQLTIRFKDDTTLSIPAQPPRGSLKAPLSDEDLEAKFTELVVPVLGDKAAASIIRAVWGIDRSADASHLTRLLTPD